jgi:hypothetical protein
MLTGPVLFGFGLGFLASADACGDLVGGGIPMSEQLSTGRPM